MHCCGAAIRTGGAGSNRCYSSSDIRVASYGSGAASDGGQQMSTDPVENPPEPKPRSRVRPSRQVGAKPKVSSAPPGRAKKKPAKRRGKGKR